MSGVARRDTAYYTNRLVELFAQVSKTPKIVSPSKIVSP
jgi:hypothetical protein